MTLDDLGGHLFATVAEVAEIRRVDRKAILQGIRVGRIPAEREGQRWRIPVAWLKAQASCGLPADSAQPAQVEPGELADLVADRVVARLARIFAALGADKETAGP